MCVTQPHGRGVAFHDGPWLSRRAAGHDQVSTTFWVSAISICDFHSGCLRFLFCDSFSRSKLGRLRFQGRWVIEVFFKMSKQHLGLGDYHLLRYRGIERYLCLVLIAHLLLTHLAFDAPDAKLATKETRAQYQPTQCSPTATGFAKSLVESRPGWLWRKTKPRAVRPRSSGR